MRAINIDDLSKVDKKYVNAALDAGCGFFLAGNNDDIILASANNERDLVVRPGTTLFRALSNDYDRYFLVEVVPDAD